MVKTVLMFAYSLFQILKSKTKQTRKPCYCKETVRFPMLNDSLIVICFSLRKFKAVIAPAVICQLKAD